MSTKEQIQAKLKTELTPDHLEIIDESSMHNVPVGAQSHFKVIVVSSEFNDLPRLARHRKVYELLTEELKSIHALSVKAYTPQEWKDNSQIVAPSPKCRGGSKAGS